MRRDHGRGTAPPTRRSHQPSKFITFRFQAVFTAPCTIYACAPQGARAPPHRHRFACGGAIPAHGFPRTPARSLSADPARCAMLRMISRGTRRNCGRSCPTIKKRGRSGPFFRLHYTTAGRRIGRIARRHCQAAPRTALIRPRQR